MIKIELKGHEKIRDELLRQAKICPAAAGIAVYGFATRVMRDSVKRTPTSSGELKGSAYVTLPAASATRLRVELGYGSEHAVPVHEDTEASHDDGEAKFLQRALDASRSGAIPQLERDFLAALKSNGGLPQSEFPLQPKNGPGKTLHPGKRPGAIRDAIRRSK